MMTSPQPASKGFSRAFWVSSTVELFERMAYYAVFIVLTIYLSNINGMVIRQGEGKVQDQRIDLNAWRAQRIKYGKSGK